MLNNTFLCREKLSFCKVTENRVQNEKKTFFSFTEKELLITQPYHRFPSLTFFLHIVSNPC